jgi:proteic killer suppression protein
VQIDFSDEALERLCSEKRIGIKNLGADSAKKLRTRLADIAAADSVQDLHAGRPHPLKGDRAGQFAVNLAGGKRLVFRPGQDPPPENEDGSIDWSSVTSVLIVFIGDYHD